MLLYSHGYAPDGAPNPAQNAPSAAVRSALLDAGYAQIGSSYPETGWVLERALPGPAGHPGRCSGRGSAPPRRTIAWGTSLGGMITTGLAERHGHRFAGTLAMCGLEQGGVANWNNTLDPLFAIRTLLTPGADTPLVRLPDQAAAFASIGQLTAALDAAQATPEGRARIALAAALHNIPAWTDAAQPEPAPGDHDTAQLNQFGVLHLTIYVGLSWRQEAEEHAGGNMSWNTRRGLRPPAGPLVDPGRGRGALRTGRPVPGRGPGRAGRGTADHRRPGRRRATWLATSPSADG